MLRIRVSNVNKEAVHPKMQWRVPLRVAASPFVSRLVAHKPALEHFKAPTTDAKDALRTFEVEELVEVWLTSLGRVSSFR